MILLLHRHNRHGLGNISLEIDDDSVNYININYIDKNNEDIEKNKKDISSNSKKISTNEGNISSNLKKITETIMLKNIYFTDFDSKDEVIVKELLHLDKTPDRSRTAGIRMVNMGYYFKKDDIIEIDCKLILHHNTYEYANSIVILFDLYDGTKQDQTNYYLEKPVVIMNSH